MSNTEFLTKVRGLQEVELLIRSKFVSDAPQLSRVSAYLFELGGKRIRPMITLTLAQALGVSLDSPQGVQVTTIAAGIELIHLATLLHDDIIDEAPVRRHKPSAYATFGEDDTLIAGDFLLSRAFALCSILPRDIILETERACVELTEGEILEIPLYRQMCSLEQYMTIAQKKTASLFRLACYSAASIAGLADTEKTILALAGEKLGIAFQVIDDILDVTSDEATLGKRTGQDLFEKKPSIINILWLAHGSPLSARLTEQESTIDENYVRLAITDIHSGAVLAEARAAATQLVHEAKSLLYTSPSYIAVSNSSEGQFVERLMEYALQRVK